MAEALKRADLFRQLKLSLIAVVIYAIIRLSFAVGFANLDVVAIWPAAGIAFWAILYFGWHALPAIWLGDLAYGYFHLDFGLHFILISTGNTLATWASARIYQKLRPAALQLRHPADVAAFVLAATGLSLIAMVVGTAVVTLRFNLSFDLTQQIAWRWFFSDLTGVILLAPPLMAISNWFVTRSRPISLLQPASITALAICALVLLSLTPLPEVLGHYPVMLLTMPLIIWLALRKSTVQFTVFLVITITAALVITLHGVGDVTEQAFLAVQAYSVIIACTALVLHSVERGRIEAMRELDIERRSLEDRVAERTAELGLRLTAAEAETLKMERLALTDELTGLLNRRGFQERARQESQRAIRYGYPVTVIMVDLDHFKDVNDTYGHAAGDQVLKTLAAIITDLLRDGIDQVGRMGGEELAVLLPHTSSRSAVIVAERLRARVEAADWKVAAAPRLRVTASFGVASWNFAAGDHETGLEQADKALYEAKKSGRNRVVISRSLASTS